MLKLKNTNGYGSIISYVEAEDVSRLDIEVDGCMIKRFEYFREDVQSHIKGITYDKKVLVFKVESFSKESIELTLIDDFVFDACSNSFIFGENILLNQVYGGNITLCNLATKEVLYNTVEHTIILQKFYMGNDTIAIAFREYSPNGAVESNNSIVFIKDGVVIKIVNDVKWVHRCMSSSDELFCIELKEDVCHFIGFDEATNNFKLMETFDLFINNPFRVNAFIVRDNKLYSYNKLTYTSKLIKDFKGESFVINPLTSSINAYRRNGQCIQLSNDKCVYNTSIPVISVTCEGEMHLIDNKGVTVDTSIKRTLCLEPYMLGYTIEKYVWYLKTDGTCWMYDINSKRKFKLDVMEENITDDNIIDSVYFTESDLVDMFLDARNNEDLSDDILDMLNMFVDTRKEVIEELSINSKNSNGSSPVIVLPKDNGVTISYINGDTITTLSDENGNAEVFDGIYTNPTNANQFFALKMKCSFKVLNEVFALSKDFDLDYFLSNFLKCTLISLENEGYKVSDFDIDDFKEIITTSILSIKLDIEKL